MVKVVKRWWGNVEAHMKTAYKGEVSRCEAKRAHNATSAAAEMPKPPSPNGSRVWAH